LCCSVYGQETFTQASVPSNTNGGVPFNINVTTNFGPTSFIPTCIINSNLPLQLGNITLDPGCVQPSGTFQTLLCNFTTFNLSATSFQNYTWATGQLIAPSACVGQTLNLSFNCSGLGGTPNTTSTIGISGSSSDLTTTLTDNSAVSNVSMSNHSNVNVISFNNNVTIYSVNFTVTNVGNCTAQNLSCSAIIPLTVADGGGIVTLTNGAYLNNYTTCTLLEQVLTCNYTSLGVGSSITIPLVFTVVNNGALNTSVQCTANGIVNSGNAYASILAYSINFPATSNNASSTAVSSSSSSNIVVNVIIPLSVFGAVMLVLLLAIAITVIAYIIIKKIRSDENVGF